MRINISSLMIRLLATRALVNSEMSRENVQSLTLSGTDIIAGNETYSNIR
jgi:hypothetical protein